MNSTTTKPPSNPTTSPGALTPEFLANLREGYAMNDVDRACHNAVTGNHVNAVALNREMVRGDDGHFSHRIKSKGITNQKKTGRCWMFAALNVMRPQVIRDHHLEKFEFSTTYLLFWDKLEKSNTFLEWLIELRDVDFLDRDWEAVNKDPFEDSGWWNYAAGLIEKYGVVPQSVMPETHSSEDTEVINQVLGRLVRARGVRMFEKHEEGGSIEDLRAMKEEALREVYRFLVLNFGVPPAEFEWRYQQTKRKDGENSAEEMSNVGQEGLTPLEYYTPQSFYKQYVSQASSDYVCLYNDPMNPLNRHFSLHRVRNIEGAKDMNFVNVEMRLMKEIAVASVLANQPVCLAVDMEPDQSETHGLMAQRLFDYETLFGIDLTMRKADRSRFRVAVSGHAMTLMGVDITDKGEPRKWLVENSWGADKGKGKNGFWTIQGEWFDEHVYTIIVHKSHVPNDILECFKEKSIQLPAWHPSAAAFT